MGLGRVQGSGDALAGEGLVLYIPYSIYLRGILNPNSSFHFLSYSPDISPIIYPIFRFYTTFRLVRYVVKAFYLALRLESTRVPHFTSKHGIEYQIKQKLQPTRDLYLEPIAGVLGTFVLGVLFAQLLNYHGFPVRPRDGKGLGFRV